MMYRADDGTVCIQFGTGDVVVALSVTEEDRHTVGISLVDAPPGKIGREVPEYKGFDIECGCVGARLFFDRVESVDVMLAALARVKELLSNPKELATWREETLAAVGVGAEEARG